MSQGKWDFFQVGKESAGGGGLNRAIRASESASDLIAREVVQNSWDAARKLRKLLGDDSIPFKMSFSFREVAGADKRDLVAALGARTLAGRLNLAKGGIKLPEENLLEHLDDGVPLRVLYISDHGAHGLYGQPQDLTDDSVMFNAIYYMGTSKKVDDDASTGGSYGFGKSAFIRGSRIRTVFVHTCFRPYAGEPNESDPVTRRALGFSWWQNHKVDSTSYDGRAQFGQLDIASKSYRPFEDADADDYARRLGLPLRDPADPAQLGTTLMVLDPTITAEELRASLERWWWPALEEHLMDLEVIDSDGKRHVVDPSSSASLRPFIEAYRVATGQRDARTDGSEKVLSANWRKRGDATMPLGTCVAVVPSANVEAAAEPDADDHDDADEDGGRTEIALMREPRMVVTYLDTFRNRRVAIKGVYIASPDLDPFLRDTEPPLHDHWSEKPDTDIDPRSTELAKGVLQRIKRSVADYAREVSPPPVVEAAPLPHFAKLVGRFLKGKGPVKPGPGRASPIEIHYVEPAAPVAVGSEVRTSAVISVRLADRAKVEQLPVAVGCDFSVLMDEAASGGDPLPVSVFPVGDSDFEPNGDEWIGIIGKNDAVRFELESANYAPLWTGRLAPTVRPLASTKGDKP